MIKPPSTLSSLIALYVGGGLIVVALILGAILFQGVTQLLDRTLEDKAQSLARQLATVSLDAVLIYDYGTIERYLKELAQDPNVRYIKLVREDKEVLGEAGDNTIDTPDLLHIEQPLRLAERQFATLFMRYDRSTTRKTIRNWFLMGSLALIIITALAFWMIRRLLEQRLVTPIKKIAENASPLEANACPSPTGMPKEIAVIADSFAQACERVRVEINERQQADLRTRHVTERLCRDQRLSAVGQMAAGLAHHLNTPLGNILGYAQQAQQETESKKTQKRLDIIVEQAQTCSSIVSNMLTSVRPPDPQLHLLDLTEQVDTLIHLMHPILRDRGVELINKLPSKAFYVEADRGSVEQILFNLLSNAAQANASNIEISMKQQGESVSLIICDNGKGIPENLQGSLFEPFISSKPAGEGTGLGLYLCKMLAEMMKSKLKLIRTDSKGTVFSLNFSLLKNGQTKQKSNKSRAR